MIMYVERFVENAIASFRKRFINDKGSVARYGKGQRSMPGEQL